MDETDQETSYQQLQRFLTSPLASWIRTLLPSGLDGADALSQYMQLVDGVLLNDVMVQIDPNPSNQRVNKGINGDVNLRIQNLAILVRHLKAYYQETLQQLVIMSPPDVLTIAKEPLSEKSLSEMQKLLLLLLGCAVQCNQKETYIEKIKLLDIDTQSAIVEHIQEVTQNQENILDVHWAELPEVPSQGLDSLARSLAYQVQRLVAERDEFSEVVMELTQERDYLQVQQAYIQGQPERSSSPSSGGLSPGDTRQHLAVELADCKAKLRRLRQELEEKTEQLTDCKHEVTVSLLEIERLQQENLQLVGEARAARGYRDEADALRERSSRVERLESEVVRYRERLHDIDFYKTRMEEVREDNVVLLETKAMLEEQLECSRSRCDGLHEAEKDNLQLRAKIHRLETERDSDRQRLEELLEENLALEFAQKQSMNESAQLGWELEQLNKSPDLGCRRQSVSTEVSEAASSRAIRLEKENHSLLQTIQELRASVQDGSPQLAKLEEEKRRLSIEVEELKESLKKEHPIIEHENLNDGEEGQPQEDVFQGGEQDGSGTGQRRVDRKSEREADRLDNMEQAHSRLQEQYFDLKQSLETARGLLARLGQEKTALEEENACLRRTVEGQRSAEARLAQAERERRELEDEQEALRRSLSSLQMEARRAERLESNVQSLATEKHRIQQDLDSSAKKVAELEKELQVVEAKNHSLRRSVEELRISSRRLEHAEQASHTLESELAQSEKSRKQLDSENRRLRQQAEVREAGLEEATARVVAFEAENRAQGREMIRLGDVCTRFKEVEKENKELVKEITMDKKTLAMLREELVTEKLKVQNQNNELEKLNNELEKIGLNKEKLLQVAHSNDETKYQLLESKIESTQKKTLELREEKITALESRLEESSNLNQQLRQELKTVKKNYEALKQREEEERIAPATSPIPSRRTILLSPGKAERDDATRELLRLKDRLIEIERNNATLQAEKQALKTQYKQLESQNNHLQTQILELQKQAVSLQEHNTSLQTQNAKLQVENSTLNSQNMSLTMQQTQLQGAQAILEAEADEVAKQHEMLKVTYDALLRDHERLAALHERQAADYEDLINRHGDLKTTHRLLEVENKDLEDRLNQLLKQKDQLVELETMLKSEREKMQQETRAHTAIAGEYQQLREENDRLNATYGRLRHEHESLFSEQKELKSELNSSRLHQARLEADCSDLRQQFQQLDVDSARLGSQCELLSHLKQKLEEENRHLLDQIQSLMQHNRDLLEHSMDSKDQFHQEQKQYIDKLNELRRQKEKLEEKIMDQYRFYSLSPPRRKSNWITTQMKKLMRPRKDGSRERLRSAPDGPPLDTSPSTHDGMDSSSVGSNSLDDIQGHHHTTARKSSTGTLQRLALRRNRARNRDKEEEKALHRRSMSMNDLGPGSQSVVTTPLPAVVSGSDAPLRERQLRSGSVDGLGDPEEPAVSKLRRRDLGCMAFSTSAMHMIAGSPSLTIHHGPEGLASSNDSVRSQRDLQSSQPTSSQTCKYICFYFIFIPENSANMVHAVLHALK
uniref:Calponin-homology (CH) domain-containing protein n=1 Tax=Eptatretus burgeri TaxID=7764 RepID=A0A8C4QD57_EPTBU